ncbi:hypothetical protein ACYOEI_36395 [Singulisphaera rosea]
MSMAIVRGKRRPRLRVVPAHSLSTRPRRLAGFKFTSFAIRAILEHWSDAEWSLLHEAEKPEGAYHIPGCGWVTLEASLQRDWPEYDDAMASNPGGS